MQLDTGQWIVIIICAILIAGYIGGYLYNRRMARQVVAWLHAGLEKWGQVTPGDPLSGLTTGGSANVISAREPFQRIEAIFILEPRENLLFWLFDRLRGRHDELILRISLRTAPGKDMLVEAGRRGDRNFIQAVGKDGKKSATILTSNGLEIAFPEKKTASGERTRSFFEQYGAAVTRLSIQRHYPHVFLRARLKTLLTQPAQDFLSDVGELSLKEFV